MLIGVGVLCRILYFIVSYSNESFSGLITSVEKESLERFLSATVYF